MKQEIIMSGFGGQGVMVMGQLLAYAGMLAGKTVSWMPSYGPEMRGGTANCSVIVSDEASGAPIVYEPTAAVVLNLPSLDKFESTVKPGGALVVNSSLIEKPVARKDIKVYLVPVNEIAAELGNAKMANMVALGALVAATDAVSKDLVYQAFAKKFASKPQLLEANKLAIDRGYDCVKSQATN